MNSSLFTLKDVAEKLNVSRNRIIYLFVSGKLSEPLHLSGHRVFDEEKIKEIQNYFKQFEG